MNSFPWIPYEGSEDDRILIRPPTAAVPKNFTDDAIERSRLGGPTPRTFAIQRRDLINYGYTPGCPGVTLLPMTESIAHTRMSAGEELKTPWPQIILALDAQCLEWVLKLKMAEKNVINNVRIIFKKVLICLSGLFYF